MTNYRPTNKTTKPVSGSVISTKKKWVSTDAWRGYEQPINSVASFNDTGTWSDSPSPSGKAHSDKADTQKILKAHGIKSKAVVGKTSNVFAINHFLVVADKDVASARAILRKEKPDVVDDG